MKSFRTTAGRTCFQVVVSTKSTDLGSGRLLRKLSRVPACLPSAEKIGCATLPAKSLKSWSFLPVAASQMCNIPFSTVRSILLSGLNTGLDGMPAQWMRVSSLPVVVSQTITAP